MPGINAGETVSLTGTYTVHPSFGRQFKVTAFSRCMPETTEQKEIYHMKYCAECSHSEAENHTEAYLSIDVVGKCHKNEWMGNVSAQLFIEDYEITGSGKYLF